jgi:hypothetical protein
MSDINFFVRDIIKQFIARHGIFVIPSPGQLVVLARATRGFMFYTALTP